MAENLVTPVRREIDRLQKEIEQKTFELASLNDELKRQEGASTSGRQRQKGTETEKRAEKGDRDRSGELELGATGASQPFHARGSRKDGRC